MTINKAINNFRKNAEKFNNLVKQYSDNPVYKNPVYKKVVQGYKEDSELNTQFADWLEELEELRAENGIGFPRVKQLLLVEDGSVDTDDLKDYLGESNPEIKVVIYRQGSTPPILVELR